METEQIEKYLAMASDGIIAYAPKALLALVILFVGIRIINKLVSVVVNRMMDRGIGADLTPFLGSIVSVGLKLMLVFVVASILGFDIAAFVGILAAAGFAVGLALQGSLSNFAAGILIVIFRPYKIGDWVKIPDEYFGQVEEIQIFNTILVTPGRKTLIVPNGEVISGVVTNFSEKGHIRLELTLLLGYEESFPKIKTVIEEALRGVEGILQDPAPEVGIESFDTHNVVVAVRPFVTPGEYWEGTFEVHAKVKSALSAAGIKMAYSEGVDLGPIGE
jgi:small conductance mechanosensitive channel